VKKFLKDPLFLVVVLLGVGMTIALYRLGNTIDEVSSLPDGIIWEAK